MVRCNVAFGVIVNVFLVVEVAAIENHDGYDSCKDGFPNVGTVLFHTEDTHRKCWVDCNMLLLQARLIAQALIPRGKVDVVSDSYIDAYINFVTSNLETTRNMAKGLAQQMMVMVLADVHGGYLRSVLLPITREAFYSGIVPYNKAIKLFELYESLKALLRTDGEGWRRAPCSNGWNHVKAQPLRVEAPSTPEKRRCACDDFITEDRSELSASGNYPKICIKPSNCTSACRVVYTTTPVYICPEKKLADRNSIDIPIPFLDDDHHPRSIAVPLRPLSLHSLDAPQAESLVTKYYVAAMRCLLAREVSKTKIMDFNRQFRRWLVRAVLPHLREDSFYPGFGGVVRVVESMVALGFEHVDPELLMPVPNEPPKVNALRSLLQAARLQGKGSWDSFKGRKGQEMQVPGAAQDGGSDPNIQKLGSLDIPSNSYADCSKKPQKTTTVCPKLGSSFQPYQSRSNQQGLLAHGFYDVLLCIVLGMVGTLLLWILCACCYCIFLRIKERSSKGSRPCGMHREYASLIPQKGGRTYHSYDGRSYNVQEYSCAEMGGNPQPPCGGHWERPHDVPADFNGQPACRIIMMEPQGCDDNATPCGDKSLEAIPSAQSCHSPAPSEAEPGRPTSSGKRKTLPHSIKPRQANYPLGSW